jgi:hypothetical protein
MRRGTLALVMIVFVGCTEVPTSANLPADPKPSVVTGRSRGSGRADGIVPQSITPMYTKYDCSKISETTWYCP